MFAKRTVQALGPSAHDLRTRKRINNRSPRRCRDDVTNGLNYCRLRRSPVSVCFMAADSERRRWPEMIVKGKEMSTTLESFIYNREDASKLSCRLRCARLIVKWAEIENETGVETEINIKNVTGIEIRNIIRTRKESRNELWIDIKSFNIRDKETHSMSTRVKLRAENKSLNCGASTAGRAATEPSPPRSRRPDCDIIPSSSGRSSKFALTYTTRNYFSTQ
ncbi:hypothetical protein EVAR_34337_1 [Eumeta japonica]|uniref:Uncharacterized protein n=1 Tax=Eumeta variegata TaxID=151549 RepID=A0A4C1VF68_EUMVA|nr:hypothetical protein EVAR_34337_1 [Eumeta japonica]